MRNSLFIILEKWCGVFFLVFVVWGLGFFGVLVFLVTRGSFLFIYVGL